MRNIACRYPDFNAQLEALRKLKEQGGTAYEKGMIAVIAKCINKHKGNSCHTRNLYDRYKVYSEAVPIFRREPVYQDSTNAINNKINNDFFSEIIDFFVGCFGTIKYQYSTTQESEEDTGGEAEVEEAVKLLSDFMTRNSFADKDNTMKKLCSVCGYVGRLLYHDPDGTERVVMTMPFDTIALSGTDLSEPEFAIYYRRISSEDELEAWRVEFYDGDYCYYFRGGGIGQLEFVEKKETLFGGKCPLQIIQRNDEMMGDAENVLAGIDAYDRAVSDTNNEFENFANAILAFKNMRLDKKAIADLRKNGTIAFQSAGDQESDLYYVTKDINSAFIDSHLDRLKNDIYRFSKTPNMSDGTFGNESGEARKFRLTGIEAKCASFESKVDAAARHMFECLGAAWQSKGHNIDPLQLFAEFTRNLPRTLATDAQAVSLLVGAGLPRQIAFGLLSEIDDIDYVMQLVEQENDGLRPLSDPDFEDEEGETDE